MATELEIIKRNFYSDSFNLAKIDKIAIEDARFSTFVNFLDECDIINSPVLARVSDTFKNGNCSLLGYCFETYCEDNTEETESQIEHYDKLNINDNITQNYRWEYSLINGFFSDTIHVTNATKTEINKLINETVRFLEKTFSKNLINDICEARDLQEQLIYKFEQNNLDRIDIYIVSDTIIDIDQQETSINLKSIDLNCRIYFWDLQKFNDLKRSKNKRLPVEIDFKSDDYNIYEVKYLKKQVSNSINYYLLIFPGNLLSDIYHINKTAVLENNVRVFLSTRRSANTEILKTLKNNPSSFFSFNNGISATAESILIENDKIIKINDFQIVNGGQTTATIHFASKKEKVILDDVFVSVKITELKKDEKYSETVGKISKAANTQTAIRESDFYANDTLLINFERLSTKNPIRNTFGNNIFYFFERMTGQYNVTKDTRGTKKNIAIWELSHPKILSYNKIDIARWYNSFELYPYTAALSAEKQFTFFMKDKDFIKNELTFNNYKTIIGFGLLFSRARKLCGTKTGKDYPSIIGDSSVGMATTIYAMSYLNFITEGCVDYWGIYEYKYDVVESLINQNKRIDSKFDNILESIIIACWEQIAKYGGNSAQEQTKKKECWDFLLKNIKINDIVKKEIDSLMITKTERDIRKNLLVLNDDQTYFNSLNILLKNNAQVILVLNNIANSQSLYSKQKNELNNLLKKINSKFQILSKKKIEDVYNFYKLLESKGFTFNESLDNTIFSFNFSVKSIFDYIFIDRYKFFKLFEEIILLNEDDFDKNNHLFIQVKEIIEKFDREFGLSIEDLNILHNCCIIFSEQKDQKYQIY